MQSSKALRTCEETSIGGVFLNTWKGLSAYTSSVFRATGIKILFLIVKEHMQSMQEEKTSILE